MLVFLISIAVCLLVTLHILQTIKFRKFPPGPWRVPMLGSSLSVSGVHIHLQAERWRQKWGPVVGLLFPSMPVVVICGPKEAFEVLKHELIQGRPKGTMFTHRSYDKSLGIILSDGEEWTNQKRFVLRELTKAGLGKSCMEKVIKSEADMIVDYISKNGPIITPTDLFYVPALNIIWTLISGRPLARSTPEFKTLADHMGVIMRAGRNGTPRLCDLCPILRKIAPEVSGYNQTYQPVFALQRFFQSAIDKQRKEVVEGSLLGAYIREENENGKNSFTDESIITVCMDLFLAGGDTSANTLGFCLLYMVLYPEVQARVHKELDTVMGPGVVPGLTDKRKLPYMDAVLKEVMRINPTAPVTAPHRCIDDININGYDIPKNTMVIVSLWSLLQNKEHWGDPENFRPQRFLGEEGDVSKLKDPYHSVFGLGKRQCLGEPLAQQTVFVLFATLMCKFTFSVIPSKAKPSTDTEPGFTVSPKPYSIIATPRH